MPTQPNNWEYQTQADNPDISVVISSIPTSDHSATCEALREQDFDGKWEIIVTEDPNLDRCEARNFGLHEAKADIVAFTDDDTRPPSDWIQSIYEAFQSNNELICIEGSVHGGIRYDGKGTYVGCNIAVDRSEAIRVGGWDSCWAGWREDTEFGWRLEEEGKGECQFDSNVKMLHPGSPRTDYKHRLETLLKEKYPKKYEERIAGASLIERAWLLGQRFRIVPYVNRVRNVVT
jgi:GT2 family glycosyltransferase